QIAGFNPFFLPQLFSNPVVETSEVVPPARQGFLLPNILNNGKVDAEAIVDVVRQDVNGNTVIAQTIVSGGNNDNTLNIPPFTVVENAGQSVIFNLRSSFRQDNSITIGPSQIQYLSSYDLSWDQFNSASQTFKVNFQIFDPAGVATSAVITPVDLSNVNNFLAAPAWIFGSGGAGSNYLLGIARSDSTLSSPLNLSGP